MQKIVSSNIIPFFLIIMSVESISITGMGVILPFVREEFQLTVALLGVVGGAIPIGMLFTFVIGKLSDRFRKINLIRTGNLIFSLSSISIFFVRDLQLLVIFLVLEGIGISFLESSINPLMIETNFERGGMMLNFLHGAWGIGAVLGPILATYVLSVGLNWRILYLLYSVMHLIVFSVSFFFSRNSLENVGLSANTIDQKRNLKGNKFWLLILLVLTALFISSSHSGTTTWLPSYLILNKNFSPELAGITLSFFVFFLTIGRFILAFFVDRFDYSLIILFYSLVASVLVFIALTIAPSEASIVFWCAAGFFVAPNLPTILAKANTVFSQYRGFITGILLTSMAIGGFLSAWIIGTLTQFYSMYVGMLFIVIALMIIVVLQIIEKLLSIAN